MFLVQHQHASGNAGTVEQPRGQANDGFKPALFDEVFARFFFLAAAKQHAVRHDGGHLAVGFEHGQHVLHEHEIGFLAFFRHPHGKATGILDVLFDVVLTERRIGQYAVEAAEFSGFGFVLRAADGVLLPDVGVCDPVQQHVHFADRPGGAYAFLPGEGEITRVTAALADVVAGLDQHAARTAGWVIHAHARPRIDNFNQRAHHVRRGVELAALFTRRIREELDQVFVCRAQQVGKFEVLVAQRNFFKVLHEVDQRVVVERTLADLAVEVDVFQHVLQRIDVGIFNRFQRLVQRATNVFFQVADGVPVRILRHEKGVVVSVGKLLGNGRIRHTLGLEIARELVSLLIEQIAQALQEQHAEDVFLVLGGIHVAAQIVTGAEQQAGKLA